MVLDVQYMFILLSCISVLYHFNVSKGAPILLVYCISLLLVIYIFYVSINCLIGILLILQIKLVNIYDVCNKQDRGR